MRKPVNIDCLATGRRTCNPPPIKTPLTKHQHNSRNMALDDNADPSVTILGVHPVRITKSSLRQAWIAENGDASGIADLLKLPDQEFEARHRGLHLIEVLIDATHPVDFEEFAQPTPTGPRSDWQAPYDEQYLDASGQTLLDEPLDDAPTRAVFFLHFLDLNRPLLTPAGPRDLPAPTRLPDRLHRLVSYSPP